MVYGSHFSYDDLTLCLFHGNHTWNFQVGRDQEGTNRGRIQGRKRLKRGRGKKVKRGRDYRVEEKEVSSPFLPFRKGEERNSNTEEILERKGSRSWWGLKRKGRNGGRNANEAGTIQRGRDDRRGKKQYRRKGLIKARDSWEQGLGFWWNLIRRIHEEERTKGRKSLQ